MKREIVIDGKTTKLEVEGSRFWYQTEGREIVERDFSIVPLTTGSYSVLVGGRSFHVVANGHVVASGRGEIIVNGRSFVVEVFDPREMRGRKGTGTAEGRQNIAATMPGKVVRVLVAQGDEVEAGQGLVVVEAMKMQNEMKSPKAGRVAEVKTKADATVAAGEVLLVIE